ncbi:MAG: flagellin lysine-N-methylase [Lachnospiraceae bacterium]|nr:flagellin lysine-N-methylase [Lachnospiraceae bacterium]
MCSIIVTIYWPDYYKEFRCKADKCLHTCCAGWLVGIDEKSLERFEKVPEIRKKISGGCFIMKKDGRCPFLRDDNLCNMILEYGEDFLCDICREHPRFYNTFDDHIEAGIGLVCEEACRLVLECEKPFELISSDGAKMQLPGYVSSVFDGSKPLMEKLSEISGGRRAGSKIRADIFKGMEAMDPTWSEILEEISSKPVSAGDEDKIITENGMMLTNFVAYLLYRYKGAGRFASEAVYLLADMKAKGVSIPEAARMFSGEVEYSDINIDEALETFG